MVYVKLLYFFKGHDSASFIVFMIMGVLKDIYPFLKVLLIVFVGFALAFFVTYGHFTWTAIFKDTLFWLFDASLGNIDTSLFIEGTHFYVIQYVMMVTYMFIIFIIFFNVIIAVIGDSYNEVMQRCHLQALREKAELILAIEFMMDRKKLVAKSGKWLHVLSPLDETGNQQLFGKHRSSGTRGFVKKELKLLKEDLLRQMGEGGNMPSKHGQPSNKKYLGRTVTNFTFTSRPQNEESTTYFGDTSGKTRKKSVVHVPSFMTLPDQMPELQPENNSELTESPASPVEMQELQTQALPLVEQTTPSHKNQLLEPLSVTKSKIMESVKEEESTTSAPSPEIVGALNLAENQGPSLMSLTPFSSSKDILPDKSLKPSPDANQWRSPTIKETERLDKIEAKIEELSKSVQEISSSLDKKLHNIFACLEENKKK